MPEHAETGGPSLSAISAKTLLEQILIILDDAKAQDLTTINLVERSQMADTMIIVTGTSNRHVSSIAEHLRTKLKQLGVKQIKLEGQSNCDWVLVNAGDVIVHIFREEVRSFYNLEKLWSPDAPREHAPS
jgi:ribosome-associated protein